MQGMELLNTLTQLHGVSGREKKVAEFIKKEMAPYADEVKIDRLGSCIVYRKGYGEKKQKFMAAAHIDQIGFCVLGADSRGYLRIRPSGTIFTDNIMSNRVVFANGRKGVVTSYPNGNAENNRDLTNWVIDIGATSAEEALELVPVSTMGCFDCQMIELANDRVCSKAFDDRIGVYVMMEAMQRIEKPYHDLYFSFSVQEEVGIRGTQVAAQGIMPDFGIAFDIGGSYDEPDDKLYGFKNAVIGNGASIKVIDGWTISSEELNDHLVALCEKYGIKYQIDVGTNGGTDAAMIQRSGSGARATTISVPTRYGHTQSEVIDMKDVNAIIDLLVKVCEEEAPFEA